MKLWYNGRQTRVLMKSNLMTNFGVMCGCVYLWTICSDLIWQPRLEYKNVNRVFSDTCGYGTTELMKTEQCVHLTTYFIYCLMTTKLFHIVSWGATAVCIKMHMHTWSSELWNPFTFVINRNVVLHRAPCYLIIFVYKTVDNKDIPK